MITFSLVSIGVKVYTAIESAQRIAFNQLHKGECLGPVGRKDYCKKCNVTIATKDEIAKGHKHGDDQWVVVTEEEIDSITPQSNRPSRRRSSLHLSQPARATSRESMI